MQEIIDQIKLKPGRVFRCTSEIANRCKISEDDAELLVERLLNGGEPIPDAGIYISDRRATKDGEQISLKSDRPLQPEEIAELAGADGIKVGLSTWWLKSKRGKVWDYSILLKTLLPNFYTKEELREKVAELLPAYNPIRLTGQNISEPQRLCIYLSDLHAGSSNKGSIFASAYKPGTLQERLLSVVSEISKLNAKVDSMDIAILGDQLDGFNAETTRGGHKLDSLSNKEQFDIYVSGMKEFYTALFSLGLTNMVTIINIDNSNHSGNGLSYFANAAIHEWLKGNFPEIKFISSSEAVFHRTYGVHAIAYTHGKDEKYMKRPMPLKLDDKTDLFLQSYFAHHQLQDKQCHLIKGDLHQYGVSEGKFGRYVNVGSIVGGNPYSDLNYGKSTPSALIEIMKPDRNWIQSIKIDLK